MTVRVTLLCHAATQATRSAAFPDDEGLDPQALARLSALPARLPGHDRAQTSPAQRAIQTAEALGLQVRPDPLLRDCAYGRWTGRTLDAVQADEPDALAAWLSDPAAVPHGGESVVDLLSRVGTWMAERSTETGAVVAVTHAAVIRAAVVTALDAGPRSFWRIDVAPLSLTRLVHNGGRWSLAGLGAMKSESTAARAR